jgi:hypothetical protein
MVSDGNNAMKNATLLLSSFVCYNAAQQIAKRDRYATNPLI